jgi:[ribosomal protein S18]-alanine N-acetyltransferase
MLLDKMIMEFFFHPLTTAEAQAMLRWRYTGEYAIYNMADEPTGNDVTFLLDPQNGYYGIHNAAEEFIAFCCFGADAQVPGGDYTAPALDIGLGLRPDLTGQGLGTGLLAAILHFGQQQRFAPIQWRATIAAFNLRSQQVFAKHGFQEIQRFISGHAQPLEFLVVWCPVSASSELFQGRGVPSGRGGEALRSH